MINEIRKNCKRWVYCNAPLCPFDKYSLKNGIWYPNEEICRKIPSPIWVKRQKKVKKRHNDERKYFTLSMLEHDFIIRKGIKGLDPNKEHLGQIQKWFLKHPKKCVKTLQKEVLTWSFKEKKMVQMAT